MKGTKCYFNLVNSKDQYIPGANQNITLGRWWAPLAIAVPALGFSILFLLDWMPYLEGKNNTYDITIVAGDVGHWLGKKG